MQTMIKVIGVGGAGTNTVSYLKEQDKLGWIIGACMSRIVVELFFRAL